MRRIRIAVDVEYDDEAKVWVATSRDVPGLVIEAADLNTMRTNILNALHDLFELNGPPKVGFLARCAGRLFGRHRDLGVSLAIRDYEILPGNSVAC